LQPTASESKHALGYVEKGTLPLVLEEVA